MKNIFLCFMCNTLNLSLKEFRLIAKNRSINVYEGMPKDKLLRINNNKKGDKKRVFNLKKKKQKKPL